MLPRVIPYVGVWLQFPVTPVKGVEQLALAPVWLMVALWWPEAGIRLVQGVILRAFGVLVAQVMLAAALAVFLLLTAALHTAFADAGWMFVSVLLTALAWLVVRYRLAWWQPLTMVVERFWRRPEPVTARRGERSEPAVYTEVAPAFSAVPESLIMPRTIILAEESGATPTQTGRARAVRPSPMEVFQTQMQRVREELILRQETERYSRGLEQVGDQARPESQGAVPLPVTAQATRLSAKAGVPSEISRITPPRPRA